MRYVSSGHSHGKQITIILEGVPSNLELSLESIQFELQKRQKGHGRGGRMKIESDQAEIVGGVLFGKTTGAPITIIIYNKDYENHKHYMEPFSTGLEHYQAIKVPRPGHADLVGAVKYNQRDTRVIFERASARETVAKVVVGAICKQILAQIGITSRSYVSNIGGVVSDITEYTEHVEQSPVHMPDKNKELEAIQLIDEVKQKKDTIGGTCVVEVLNVPMGIGSYVTHDKKLDARIALGVLGIQSCKGVEFGDGFQLGNLLGSQAHDEIVYEDGFKRSSNHYGGIEGGMTTGMPIVVKAVFKPIPTLMQPLKSIHLDTKEETESHIERSDVCVVPSASIICEATVVYEVTTAILEQFTSDSMEQLIDSINHYRLYTKRF